jgi:hypothetical protein
MSAAFSEGNNVLARTATKIEDGLSSHVAEQVESVLQWIWRIGWRIHVTCKVFRVDGLEDYFSSLLGAALYFGSVAFR